MSWWKRMRTGKEKACCAGATQRQEPVAKMLVWVPVNPEVAKAQMEKLRDLDVDNPYWLAVVLVGTSVQSTLLAGAMKATGADRERMLAEAQGAGALLRTLEEMRAGTEARLHDSDRRNG